jgi:hypothetical protein
MLARSFAVLLAALLAWSEAVQVQEGLPPFRYVEIAPEQVSEALRRQPALVPLPRRDFDSLLQRAARPVDAQAQMPPLVEARYTARFEPESNSLIGQADWTLPHAVSLPQLLRLQPCNLAWQHLPQLQPGPPWTARFAWSVRGEPRPDGLRLFLQTPAAPVAVLDLDVPPDRVVECPGFRPTVVAEESDTKRTRWRVVFGSPRATDLEVLIRPADFPDRPRLLWSAVTSTLTVSPVGCDARFVVDLRVLHRQLREVRLHLLGPLQVFEVVRLPRTAPPVVWSLGEGPEAGTVLVRFADPIERQTTLELRCRCDLPEGNQRFTMPGLRVADAWTEPENLRIRLLQGLIPTRWDLADFRLAETPTVERDASELYEVLRLVQTVPFSLAARRPSLEVHGVHSNTAVSQDAWWRPGADGSSLQVLTRWRVRNQPIYRLGFLIPENTQVEQAEVIGHGGEVTWLLEPQRRLIAEFREPLPIRSTVKTRLALRLDTQDPRQPHAVPAVVPLEADILESGLGVSPGEQIPGEFSVRLADGNAISTTVPDGPDRPWSDAEAQPAAYFLQRGRIITGRLEIVPEASSAAASPAISEAEESATARPTPAAGTKPDVSTAARPGPQRQSDLIPRISDIQVTTWLEPDGEQSHLYEARIVAGQECRLIGSLPDDVHLETVRLGATSLPPTLQLTVPEGITSLRITYRSKAGAWQHIGLYAVPVPTWQPPVRVAGCRHHLALRTGQVLAYPPTEPATNPTAGRSWQQDNMRTLASSPGQTLMLLVLPSWLPHLAGGLLTLSLVGFAWWSIRGRWMMLAAGLLVGLLALIWLPGELASLGWWLVLGCSIGGLLLRQASLMRDRVAGQGAFVAASAGLGLFLLVASGEAQGPGDVVFVLREADRSADHQRVLVPHPLLRKLQTLADPERNGGDVLLLEADYEGRITDGTARITASFVVEVRKTSTVELTVPLLGVRLEQALLDGEPVLVGPQVGTILPGEGEQRAQGGLVVPLTGEGRHRLALTFQVPIRSERGIQEVRFGIPPVCVSRCRVMLPGDGIDAHLVGIRGRQRVGTREGKQASIEADLGRVSEFHLRWYVPVPAEEPPALREAYVLEVSPEDLKLRGVVRLEGSSFARQIRVTLPTGMHVQSVELRGEPDSVPPLRLRDWRVEGSGAQRVLVAETARPPRGPVYLLMELAIRDLPLDPLPLMLPVIHNSDKRETLFACRASGFSVDPPRLPPGWSEISEPTALARLWPAELGSNQNLLWAAMGTQAAPAEWHLQIRPERSAIEITPLYRLRPEAAAAEVQVRLACLVRRGGPALLALDLPPDWLVGDVQGPDLYRWTLSGRRLELWLKKLEGERTSVEIQGWIPAVQHEGTFHVALAPIQASDAVLVPGRLELAASDGFSPSRLNGVAPAEGAQGLAFVLERSDFSADFVLSASPAVQRPSLPRPATTAQDPNPKAKKDTFRIVGALRRTLLDDGLWVLHREGLLVRFAPGAVLPIRLPEGCEIHAVRLDGREVQATLSGDRLLVGLPSREGVGFVEIMATLPVSRTAARLTEMRGLAPIIEGPFPVVWQVRTVSRRPSEPTGPATAAEYHLAEARLWLALLRSAESVRPESHLPTTPSAGDPHEFLLRSCRAALDELGKIAQTSGEAPLREQAAALEQEFAAMIEQLGDRKVSTARRSGGSIAELHSDAVPAAYGVYDNDPQVFRFHFPPSRLEGAVRSLQATAVLLGLAAALLLLRRLDPSLRRVVGLWPEIVFAVGVAGWWWRPDALPLALVLIAVALAARVRSWLVVKQPDRGSSSARTVLSTLSRPGSP